MPALPPSPTLLEGVSFTVAESAAVVALANTATLATLDREVPLDRRAAGNLVAGRPFTTLAEVARVRYVGPAALDRLRRHVGRVPTADAFAALGSACAGLWFTSESDYPLVAWQLAAPGAPSPTATNVRALLAPVSEARPESRAFADRAVEGSSLAWVFDPYTVEQDWWEDDRRAGRARWSAVRAVFEGPLGHTTAWRFGRRDSFGHLVGDIDVFVVGVAADGGWVGIRTVSIET
jgi:hypothetical protein